MNKETSPSSRAPLQITQVAPASLNPAAYNPRKWSDAETAELRKSIERFGLIDPIIVNSATERRNVVIGGHFRLKVAKDLGFETVPVVYVCVPDLKREQELNLRLNRNTGSWDFDLLEQLGEDVLSAAGFESKELDDIFTLDGDADDDAIPAIPETPRARRGDIYQLGRHRIMCGEIVLDLFLGSGSTLIAAENADRICYGMELEPKYIDVIIARWEQHTGGTAKKVN